MILPYVLVTNYHKFGFDGAESGTSVPIKGQEEKQYWTVFFEHDLYPGKQMSLGVHKHSDVEPSRSKAQAPFKKASQFSGTRKWLEKPMGKADQPFGTKIWLEQEESEKQPFGTRIWLEQGESEKQPFGTRIWLEQAESEKQPFGTRIWLEQGESEKQPFGTRIWLEQEESEKQPFGRHISTHDKPTDEEMEKPNDVFGISLGTGKVSQSIDNAAKKETEKISQISVGHAWDEKETRILHSYCENPSAIGEEKHCAQSLQSMMDFAISKLGKNIKVMSSSFSQNQDQYVVEEVKKIGDNAVMCHRLNFKNVAFYCHQVNATTIYMVPLVASDGTKSKALTICHHDTRGMNPNMLYKVLKVKPGTVPVCHFIGNKAVAWVPDDDVTDSDCYPSFI